MNKGMFFQQYVELEISLGGASKISATVDIYSHRYTLISIFIFRIFQ
jgi:hypothetical protein